MNNPVHAFPAALTELELWSIRLRLGEHFSYDEREGIQ